MNGACFIPGSEWLYLKIYTGIATADRIINIAVRPLCMEFIDRGLASSWFFIRYSDPDHHLRVRLRGKPESLLSQVLPRFSLALQPLLEDRSLWKVELGTYEPEIDRYGGPEGIELVEELFAHDSHAVVEILDLLDEGESGLDARWKLALRGSDMILADLGFNIEERLLIAQHARAGFEAEFQGNLQLHKTVGMKFRQARPELFQLLARDSVYDAACDLAAGVAALEDRSRRSLAAIDRLRELDRLGRLRPSLSNISGSLVHMHINRLVHANQRAHELILYDYLVRWYLNCKSRSSRNLPGSSQPQFSESQEQLP